MKYLMIQNEKVLLSPLFYPHNHQQARSSRPCQSLIIFFFIKNS